MPTYDYECAGCGHVFEVIEGMHDVAAKECPKCRKRKAKRRLSAPAGLIFKGSGFHVTDYRGPGGSPSPPQKKTARKKADTTNTKSDKTEKK